MRDEFENIIRKWRHHWIYKEPGYSERASHLDANMIHHLADMLEANHSKALTTAMARIEILEKAANKITACCMTCTVCAGCEMLKALRESEKLAKGE